jgi:thymidylate synthase
MNVSFVVDHGSIFGPSKVNEVQQFYMGGDGPEDRFDPTDLSCSWYDKETTNKTYAWRIFSEERGSQFATALGKLREDPKTRRAVMYYNDPNDTETSACCTSATLVLNDDGKLDYYVSYRSNDAYNAFANDVAWHNFVHNLAVSRFNRSVTKGKMYWHVTNLHVLKDDIPKVFKPMTTGGWRFMWISTRNGL